MKNSKTESNIPVRRGSGNVFDDLGLGHADERLAKAELVRQIADVIHQAGWSQAEAAKRLGTDQPKVSTLLRGQTRGFSTDRLLRFLTAIGQDIEIIVRPKKKSAKHRPAFRVIRHVT